MKKNSAEKGLEIRKMHVVIEFLTNVRCCIMKTCFLATKMSNFASVFLLHNPSEEVYKQEYFSVIM